MSETASMPQSRACTDTPTAAALQDLQERVAALEARGTTRKNPQKGSEARRTAITNETLFTVKADLETVVKTVQAIMDGDTITTACAKNGIPYRKFCSCLNYARLPYNENHAKCNMRLDEKRFSTWEERLYADMFSVQLGSGELADLMPDDAEETIREALKMLPDRERQVIETLYEHGETLDRAGKLFGVSRERVRQIARTGLVRIRRRYGREMQCGIAAVKQAAQIFAEQKQAMILELVEKQKAMDGEYRATENRLAMLTDERARSVRVEDMGLSTRAYNVLARGEIRTLADLLGVTNAQTLLRMRNCGPTVYHEIVDAVHRLGYAMRWE